MTSMESPTSTSIKRKADEAFDALDDALRPNGGTPSPPPKRANTIYGSLAKYGILNRPSSTSKAPSTPTLTALLTRARSRKSRKPLPMLQLSQTSSATPEYSPGSTDAFLQRLSTFNLSTYPSKPPQIDAVAASKNGWINEGGKDRLFCAICKVGWVIAGRDGLNREAANALVEKQKQAFIDMHKEGCPWRVRQCDALVYRIPLQSPANLARQVNTRANELEPLMDGIAIRHPLSLSQVQSFLQIVASVPPQANLLPPSNSSLQEPTPPSTASLLTSLFGWSLVRPPPPVTRKSSSASLTLARTLSVQSHAGPSRACTPSPGTSTAPTPFQTPVKTPSTPFGTPINGKAVEPSSPSREPISQKDAMLHCQMCQRRIGLWAFSTPGSGNSSSQPSSATPEPTNVRPQRQLDLLREHRSYCPYVVKSTPLASLPSYPSPPPSRTSFGLARTGTSLSVGETPSFNFTSGLRRTASLLSGTSTSTSHVRTGSLSSGAGLSSASLQETTLVEGWRAIYNTVLRYGMSERSRVRMQHQPQGPGSVVEGEEKGEDDAMNGVIELVEGVKQHGGKQLLSYIRNLLG
ncbi:zf-C3HC-domain-containing protein [Ramaria rubella]|nr:zf-C3HC-domain-containing protein [Ramaria rubella]